MTDAKSSKKFQKFHCDSCDYNTSKKSQWNRHISTQKHKTLTNTYNKNVHFYFCECGKKYKHRQSLYTHKITCKYFKNTNHKLENGQMANFGKQMANFGKLSKNVHFDKKLDSECKKMYICHCGKEYKHNSSLSKHKNKCIYNNEKSTNIIIKDNDDPDWKSMFMELMKQNSEVLETCKDIAQKPTTINNTQFNVMNYLNTE